jgi:uncharacterized ion transporter superfamily protein YfcC
MTMRALRFPTPYSVLMVVMVIAAGATWLLPAGRYDTLSYNADRKTLVASTQAGERDLGATQATLDSLHIQIALSQFVAGDIRKPVSIPGTYVRGERKPQGFFAVLMAPVLGIQAAIDVILFVLIIGGYIAVFSSSGAFEAGINALAHRLRGREKWLIVIVTALVALGGTTYGMAEETIAFYPLLVPIFVAAGYDVMVPLATIFVGSSVGFMASTTNPFAVIIASDAAGIAWTTGLTGRILMWLAVVGVTVAYIIRYANRVKADPSRSLAIADLPSEAPALAVEAERAAPPALTGRIKLLLTLFVATFVVMIFGVARLGWWFTEMTTLFLVVAVVIAAIERMGEAEFVKVFLKGAGELLGVAFIIGFARGVTILLDNGEISSTIVNSASGMVQGMPGVGFIVGLLGVYAFLTLFIASSSGMAVLTMPIMGTLGIVAGVPREEIVNAFMYGMGLMGLVAPVGLILPSLAMVNVSYSAWLRFVWPLLALLTGVSILFLAVGVLV